MAISWAERKKQAQKNIQEEQNRIELQKASEEAILKEIQNEKAEKLAAALTGTSDSETANKDAITQTKIRANQQKKAAAAAGKTTSGSTSTSTGSSTEKKSASERAKELQEAAVNSAIGSSGSGRSSGRSGNTSSDADELLAIMTGTSDNESAVKDYMTNYKRYAAEQTKQKQAVAEIQKAAKQREAAQNTLLTGAENVRSASPTSKLAQSRARTTASPISTGKSRASRYLGSSTNLATPTASELETIKNTGILRAQGNAASGTVQTPSEKAKTALKTAASDKSTELGKALNGLGYGTERLGAAILGAGEGVTDMIGSGFWNALAAILPAGTSAETFAKEAADRFLDNSISRDWEESIAERYQPTRAQEVATDITGSAAQMLPMIATGTGLTSALSAGTKAIEASKAAKTADLAQKVLFGLQAAGNSASEAKQEGASTNEALLYGLASGILETETEAMFGGIPGLSEGQLDDILEMITGGGAISKLLDIAGEGAEEAVSEIVTPYLQRAVYDENAENASLEDILKAAALGSATAGILQAGIELPSSLYNRATARTDTQSRAAELEAAITQNLTGQTAQEEGGANNGNIRGTTQNAAGTGRTNDGLAAEQAAAGTDTTGQPGAGTDSGRTTTSQYASELAQRAAEANAADGNGQRVASAGAVGQAGAVAAGTAGAQGGNTGVKQSRTASGRRTRAQDSRLERVSSRELGVWQGTDSPVNMVMPESLWDAEMQEAAQTAKDVSGYQVQYVINKMQTQNGGTARGTIVGDTIYVQADDIRFSVSQIVDHELYHTLALADSRINAATRESVLNRYSEAELDEVVSQYAMELMGAYGLSENATEAEYQAYLELMQEEVFADAYAGMNAFGAGANRFQSTVRESAETWQSQTAERASEKQTSAATTMTNGPGENLSVDKTPLSASLTSPLIRGDENNLSVSASGAATSPIRGGKRSDALLAELPEGIQEDLREWNQTENKWDYDGPLGDLELRLDDLHAMDSQAYNTAIEYLDALGEEENSSQQAQSSSQQPRFSIDYDASNQPFVTVDEDILDGVPESEWVKTVKQNLKEKFPDGITVGNNEIQINSQSRSEMTFSKYMQKLFNTEPDIYADKLRTTNNADEILQAAQNWVNEALLHPRKDTIIDFARGTVQLRVGENDYNADVIVGNKGNGNLLLYDIINLEPTQINTNTEAGATYTANAQEGPRSRGLAPASGNSITQNGQESKRNAEENAQNAPKTQPRFSLASPVEYTEDLIAVHNLSEENLEQTLELGGFPAPSIAIVNATQGHTQFGDYSVVFNRSAIDPEADSRNRVYGRDAWTPTVGGSAQNANTAEEIVRAMYESGTRTGVDANGMNAILTATAPRFQSVEEMHGESDRIWNYSKSAYNTDWQRMRTELHTLEDELLDQTYGADENSTVDDSAVSEAIIEAARRYGTGENGLWADEIQGVLAEYGVFCDEETAGRIESLLAEAKAMPTDYFEAKPERVVGLDEVAAIIAPDDIPDSLFEKLAANENDIDIRLYRRGHNGERLDALNSLEGVRFSNGGGSLKTELKSNLRSNFGIGSGNVKKASDAIESMLDSVTREEGQRAARDQLFETLTELGTVEDEASAAQAEYYKPIANRLRGSKVYVPDSVKAEFGDDWSSFRRKAFGKGIYLTGDQSAQGVDMLNAELADQYPGTFDAGESDPRAMLESMVTAAENARPEMISLQEYAIRTAERYGLRPSEALSGTRAEFDRLLDEYAAGMTRAESGTTTSQRTQQSTDKNYLLESDMDEQIAQYRSSGAATAATATAQTAEGGGSNLREYWQRRNEREARRQEARAEMGTEENTAYDDAEEAAQRDRESYEKLSPEQRAAIDRLMQSPEYTPPTMASRMLRQERETIQSKAQSLDELKAIMRGAAEGSAIQTDRDSFTGTENLNKLGVKVAGSVTDYWDVERLTEIDKAAKDISNHVQRYAKGSGLSEKELDFASRIAAGVYDESDIPTTMNAGRVLHMAELYAQQAAANADVITARRSEIAQKLQSEAGSVITEKMIQNAKVSKTLTLNYRSPDRNMRHIFGDTEGEKVNQWVFEPLHANEAERQRWVNQMYDQVRKFTDSKGKQSALSKTERAVVQQVIEGKAAGEMAASMERGSEIQEAAKQLADGMDANQALEGRDFSEDQIRMANRLAQWEQTQRTLGSGKVDTVKVENAVNAYTELFDQLYKGTNDFLIAHGYEPIGYIEGYAPHMQPDETQNKLKKAFQAMGLNTEVTNLPAEIAGLTANYKPNKNWNPYFLTRTTDTTKFDIAEAYESYIDYLSGVFYHTDDIMRLRQLTNFFRKANATEALRDNVTQAEELRSKSREFKAKFLRDNGEISADSVLNEKDLNEKLEKYIEKQYEDLGKGNTRFSSLAMWLDNYTNIMARKQSAGDRGPETIFGRKALNLGNKIIASFGRAQVAGNLSSALNQMAQLPMIAAELGPKYTTEAIAGLAGIGNKEARGKAWRESSDYLTSKHGIDYLVQSNTEKLMSGLFAPASMADELLSEVAVRGRYLKELDAGKSAKEAMKIADNYGREVMGTREKGFRPTAFENKAPLMAALNVFQTEAWNTVEHITQDTFGKDFRKMVQEQGKTKAVAHTAAVSLVTLILSYLLNRGSDELYGGTPAQFDVLGYLTDFVAGGNGVTAQQQAEHWVKSFVNAASEKLGGEAIFEDDFEASNGEFDWQTALGDLWYDFSSDMPFLRNAAGLLGWGDESIPMPDVTTITDFASSLTDEDATAAERLEKAGEAVAQWIPGGRQLSKTYTGLKSALQGGKYSGYGDEKKLQYPITENRSKVTAALFGNSALDEAEEYWAEDRDTLSVSQTKLYESLAMQGADQNTVYETILQYREIGRDDDLTSLEKGVQQRAAVLSAGLEDEQALELYTGLAGSDSKTEKLTTMVDAGLTLAESFAAYDEWATLDADEDMEDEDKATQFAMWADRQGFTEEQAQTVKDTLKFWASRPVEASGYNRFTEAGLDTEAAEELTDILDDLEPEDGEDSVSSSQRNMAIAESPLSDSDKDAALESYLKDSQLTKYQEARAAGLSPLEWVEYYTETNAMESDKDENGKTVSGSKRAKVLAYIDEMDITDAQKDMLYYQSGYSESTIDEAPWH